MNKDKTELTWDRICNQISKKRFNSTPRTHFARLRKSSKPDKTQKRGAVSESDTGLRCKNRS